MNRPPLNPTASTPATGNPWLSQTVEIRAMRPEIDDVITYDLTIRDSDAASAYRFRPGQFNMLYLPGAGEVAISLSGDPAVTDTLAHTIRTAGNVTRELSGMQPGQTLGLRGPFGSRWPIDQCIGRDVVLVAGGIGLPPLRPVIYELLRQPRLFGRLNLLYGARSPKTQLYTDEYDVWAAGGLNLHTTVDRSQHGWKGNVGVVPLLLERLPTFDPQTAVLLACGPEVMLRFTAKAALERGMSAQQIWVSTERNMQCAIGLCGHCQLGPEFVCKDGPVFRYDRIAPYLKVEGL